MGRLISEDDTAGPSTAKCAKLSISRTKRSFTIAPQRHSGTAQPVEVKATMTCRNLPLICDADQNFEALRFERLLKCDVTAAIVGLSLERSLWQSWNLVRLKRITGRMDRSAELKELLISFWSIWTLNSRTKLLIDYQVKALFSRPATLEFLAFSPRLRFDSVRHPVRFPRSPTIPVLRSWTRKTPGNWTNRRNRSWNFGAPETSCQFPAFPRERERERERERCV